MKFLLLFLLGTAISLFLTPRVIHLCYRWGLLDHPTDRKIHAFSTPLAGGLVLFPVAILSLLLTSPVNAHLLYLVLATTGIFVAGLWDDRKGIHFSAKFAVQIAAALLVMQSGIVLDLNRILLIKSVGIPFSSIFSSVITLLWIVGITNAVNLVDGVDGLAVGLSLNAFAGIGALSLASGSINPAVCCTVMIGGILGFMRYNIYPARTFLGDSGSMLLGFLLAVTSIQHSAKTSTFLVLGVPVLLLAIPMLDTSLAFSRRAIRLKNPFEADREHLHHRLLDLNFTTKQVLGIFYGLSATLGILGMVLAQTVQIQILSFAILLLIVILGIVKLMQIYNISSLVRRFNMELHAIVRKAVGTRRDREERLKANFIILSSISFANLFLSLYHNKLFSPLVATAATLFALGAMDIYLNRVEDSPRYELTRMAIFLSIVLNQIIFIHFFHGDSGSEIMHIFGTITGVVLIGWFLFRTRTFVIFLTDPVDVLALYLGALGAGLAKHYLGAHSLVPFGIALANALIIYSLVRVYLAGYWMRSRKNALGFTSSVIILLMMSMLM